MKKVFLLLLTISVIFSTSYAQKLDFGCGTTEYLKKQFKENPGLEKQFQELEYQVQQWINENRAKDKQDKLMSNITIPVVVHIIYNSEEENISDEKIAEQLEISNRDFAGDNTNLMGAFAAYLKTNTGIQFELAETAPDGSSTTGIERRQTSVIMFNPNDDMKYYIRGGLDAWDPNRYFNIWVCNLLRYAGYAVFPTTNLGVNFGVVINYTCFGTYDDGRYRNLGATTTHEIGHCFNLRHIWGDDNGACTGTDYVDDTPNQAYPTYYTFGGKVTDDCSSNSPGIMYMNFMDYSADVCLANFTPYQAERMQACFANSSSPLWLLGNSSTYNTPSGCETPGSFVLTFSTKTTATLEWQKIYNATTYNIRYRKSGTTTWTNTSTTSNTIQITGLSKNTTYEYQVQSVTSNCNSIFSEIRTFKTPNQDYTSSIGSVPLVSPENNASNIEISQTLSWNSISNVNSYILQVSLESNFASFIQVRMNATSYKVSGLEYNKTYYWRVKGCNPSYSGPWTQRSFTTLSPTLLKPALLYPLYRAGNIPVNLTFDWESVAGAAEYILQYTTDNFANITEITTQNTEASVTLSPGTLYQCRVRARNGNEVSYWSNGYFATESTISAVSTLLLTPVNNSTGIILDPTFTWEPLNNATYYVMQYSTDNFTTIAGAVITVNTFASVSGLNANKQYYWRVRASITESDQITYFSQWSDIFTFSTESVTLSTPTLVAPTNGSTNISINPALSWNAVQGASSYVLNYSTDGSFENPSVINSSGTTVNLNGLNFNTQYYWRVKAVNGQTESNWSQVWSFTTETENLPSPTLVSPANNATKVSTSPTFAWNPVSGATYYTLDYSISSDFSSSVITVTPINGASQRISNLAKNTNYYWRVKANNQYLSSPWSSTFKFKTSPTGKIYADDYQAGELEIETGSLIVYPNPFSSETRIVISLPQSELIELKITDILGRTVANLINEEKNSGVYYIDFDGSQLEPGIYFCNLKSGSFNIVSKLIIMR